MERRFLLFLVLSFLVIQVNFWLFAPPKVDKPAAQKADNAAPVDQEGDKPAEAADAPGEAAEAADAVEPPVAADAEEPLEYVTIGSANPASEYRMLVTATTEGAGLRRIELSSPRYLDVHDRGGYLGHLELIADGGTGLLVRTVGAGTPAAEAKLQVGDRLLEAGRDKLTPLAKPEDLAKVLGEAKPKQKLSLVIERDGKRQTLVATLRRRPLEVTRPESENILLRGGALLPESVDPASFLLTLQEVDKKKIADDAQELPGVDLRKANWTIVDQDENSITFERRVPEWGLLVTKRYALAKLDDKLRTDPDAPAYHLTLKITIANMADAGGKAHNVAYRLDGPNGLPIEGWWYATKIGRDWGAAGIRDVIGRFVGGAPKQQSPHDIAEGEVEDFAGGSPMAYMGVDAQYFCAALLPQTTGAEESWITSARSMLLGSKPDARTEDAKYANVTCRLFSQSMELKPGESRTHTYQVFAGPKRPELLAKYAFDDEQTYTLSDYVYYGWFGPVAQFMVGLLHFFYGFVGNYGIAIITLTALVRSCMFPISRGQARSMARLQELRPEMERIKEKHKGDQQKQAQAMQQLYRKHNVNPLAGCLPMLIQLPVFIGLYRGLAVDVELRGAPLFGESIRWCSDLAAPDMFYDWSWFMPNFINRGEGIFGLGPYLNVLPLVTIVLFLLQQKMFMPEPANEQAALQQKIMKYMMIFMGLLFYKVPSGLCLYFIASSLWGIAERKLVPPLTAPPATADGAIDSSPAKAKKSLSAQSEKRAGRNGRPGGKSGAKPKRRR